MEPIQQTASIWRYDLEHGGTIQIPAGARIMAVAWLNDGLKLWAMCDPEMPKMKRVIHMISTGHTVGETWDYCGTVPHGTDVWHVFLE